MTGIFIYHYGHVNASLDNLKEYGDILNSRSTIFD